MRDGVNEELSALVDQAVEAYEEHHPGHACKECLGALLEPYELLVNAASLLCVRLYGHGAYGSRTEALDAVEVLLNQPEALFVLGDPWDRRPPEAVPSSTDDREGK